MSSRDFSADDMDFVRSSLQQEPLFAKWMTKKKSNRQEERLFAVGSFQILSISKNRLGTKSVRRSCHLYDITEINSPLDSKLLIVTKEWRIEFAGDYVDELLATLIRAYNRLTHNWPPAAKMNRFIQPESRIPMCVESALAMDGFALSYEAYCRYFQAPFQQEFIEFLSCTVDPNLRIINLSEYPWIRHVVGDKRLELRPIAFALKFNRYFRGIKLCGVTQQRDAISEFSEAFATNSAITSLSLSGLISQGGYDSLGKTLSTAQYCALEELDLSGNFIKDLGVSQIIPGLARLRLRFLDLSRCDITSKGISALAALFRTTVPLSESLVALNLSHNRINESASKSIMEWLDTYKPGHCSLRTLLLGKTGFDVSCMGSLPKNHKIEILDVSGSKISPGQGEVFASYIEKSQTLTDIDLSSCVIGEQTLFLVVKAIVSNENIKKSMVDLSLIPMNPSFAYNLSLAFATNKNLHTLCLDETGIKTRGLLQLLSPLMQIRTLRRLHIGRIVKPKSENRINVVRKLVQYLNTTQLEILHVAGDETAHIGADLVPVIQQLAENSTIVELNVTGQEMGDDGLVALGQTLAKNKSIKRLYCDGQVWC
eukprot:TRINITY_DN4806_c0_g1_i1.p1 TRINITY_DN4806_c0_g1~~TRINITY_DN4806_c0_g1_i1.p1  ORF type:complete len:598 (-),score=104.15 TRINITY_DN4806_c0_g1_i1:153-1946(-)